MMPKVFDVTRPGHTPASPTSRPVIVGHHSKVQDSTLTDKPSGFLGEQSDNPMMDAHDKVDLRPSAEAASSNPESKSVAPTAPIETQLPVDAAPEPPRPSVTATSAPPEAVPAVVGATAPPTGSAETPPNHNESPIGIAAPEPEKDSLAYAAAPMPEPGVPTQQDVVVSHHAGPKVGRRSWPKILIGSVIILVLAAAALDILLDAGVWKPAANIPHTHFIK
jgi:hypothetical protein